MTAGIITLALLVGANPFNETFDRATEAYRAGELGPAIELLEQLVDEQVFHPAVFYNLGNAYYRAGQLGAAIANYERALQVWPDFERAAYNLIQSVKRTERRLARPLPSDWEQSLLFWHYNLPPPMTAALATISWISFWGLLAISEWRPIRHIRSVAFGMGVLALLFGASAWVKAHPTLLAVAAEQRVPVRYSTAENATVHFELYEGDRVTVDSQQDGWARVITADGKRGWALRNSLIFVGPPYARGDGVHVARSGNEMRP